MSSKNEVNAALVKKIKDKFGKISTFIEASGIDKKIVRLNLYRKNEKALQVQEQISELVDKTQVQEEKNALKKDLRDKIRVAIYTNYLNVADFIKKHPEYTSSYISYITNKGLKYRNEKVNNLLKILNLE